MAAIFKVRHCTCASRHSTFRLPSALRAVKGCHPPCDFQSTASTLRVSAACIRIASCRLKPLSHDAGHVFAFCWGASAAQADQSTSMSVSCGCVIFWTTQCHSPNAFRLRATQPTFETACARFRKRAPASSRSAPPPSLAGSDSGTTFLLHGSHVGLHWTPAPPVVFPDRGSPRDRSRGPQGRGSFPAPCFTDIPGRLPETPPGGREDRLAWFDPLLRGRRSVELPAFPALRPVIRPRRR